MTGIPRWNLLILAIKGAYHEEDSFVMSCAVLFFINYISTVQLIRWLKIAMPLISVFSA